MRVSKRFFTLAATSGLIALNLDKLSPNRATVSTVLYLMLPILVSVWKSCSTLVTTLGWIALNLLVASPSLAIACVLDAFTCGMLPPMAEKSCSRLVTTVAFTALNFPVASPSLAILSITPPSTPLTSLKVLKSSRIDTATSGLIPSNLLNAF